MQWKEKTLLKINNMKITKVTITGADDSISPEQLIAISERFPFVEWGILLSKNSMGRKRFPSEDWMKELFRLSQMNKLQLSGHLCGKWVRDIVFGNGFTFLTDMPFIYPMFQRFQLNFHAIAHKASPDKFVSALKSLSNDVQFIFQFDDVNNDIIKIAQRNGINCAALFDTSGGIGKLPDEWKPCVDGLPCGYAGGLSPDNLEEQLKKIEHVAGTNTIWIDVETLVRSNNDFQFDLSLVTKFIEVAESWEKQKAFA